ncbi:calcium-binding protein [Microvirga sp. BT325]|uniref:Calcium-binding protein n=2 Tax=Microvirga splendida TaxID=2795727 RepID=A0ABS0Y2V4_9HYPH|nr:calcium-binding protein [Microvirga splendida]
MPGIGLGQDALWGAGALKLPPIGTSKNDVLKGDNGINGFYGLGGNDTIYGYGGYDALAGGAGNDKLYGGRGNDNFIFDTKLNAKTNVDKIMDFKSSEDDMISLSRKIFKKVGPAGGLKEEAFHVGKKAHDADDRIVYDKATGSLYYDPDGTGRAVKIKFATLVNKATLTHDDFAIG